jgi:plasmid stabilization system protein ParE
MAYRILIQRRAERDIEEAFLYIEERQPAEANRWYKRLRTRIESLSAKPLRCGSAPEALLLGVEIRQLVIGKRSGKYRVIFAVDEGSQTVDVLTVRHGARKPLHRDDIE